MLLMLRAPPQAGGELLEWKKDMGKIDQNIILTSLQFLH